MTALRVFPLPFQSIKSRVHTTPAPPLQPLQKFRIISAYYGLESASHTVQSVAGKWPEEPFKKSLTMCYGTWKGTPSPFGHRQFVPEKGHTWICFDNSSNKGFSMERSTAMKSASNHPPNLTKISDTTSMSESTDSAVPETADSG